MPWKGEKDAYKIWLSEIILQQTRVEQGLSYYNKFIEKYPTITLLANAKDDDVFKLWEGLGYYSRCKNLLVTARIVATEYKGIFPDNYENILQLKGVGTYTAAAIASFAYNLPFAVLDGNVFRVLSRFFAINLAIDSTKGKEHFSKLAQNLLDIKNAASYNQAIMDLGATVCKPKLPICDACPLQKECIAYNKNSILTFPFKQKKILVTERWMNFLVIKSPNKLLIGKRESKDIWQGLYQFFPMEVELNLETIKQTVYLFFEEKFNIKGVVKNISSLQKQRLTHKLILGHFIEIELEKEVEFEHFFWIKKKEMNNYSFPKFINSVTPKINI